ncbi:MAG: type II toxin-antitoxin system HicA family toxin [Mycobacteriales bacterium]
MKWCCGSQQKMLGAIRTSTAKSLCDQIVDKTPEARWPGDTAGMPETVREIITLLTDDGWVHIRTKGSHRQYRHILKPDVITVPDKLSRGLPLGLERSILKKARLDIGKGGTA